MDEVELLLRRYGDDVDEQCPPVTLAELERRLESTAADPSAIGPGHGDDATADGGGGRGRRLMVLAAAVVVLLAATVAVVIALVDGDKDSNRVITEQTDTPVTVQTPATTVAPTVTEAPSPTTEVPPPTASPAVAAEWSRAPFAPPPGYGEPFGTLSCCLAAEDFQFTLLASPGGPDDPFADGDLLIMTLPWGGVPNGAAEGEQHSVRGTTGYSGRYFNFPNLGFTGDLTWAEGPLGAVVLASRSYTSDELAAVSDSLDIDESTSRFVTPEGFVPIADQGYDAWLGPLSSTPSDHVEYRSTWTTGGGSVEETINVKATPASDGVLELVEFLVEDTERVQVRGSTGVLGTYGGSRQLSWIEDDTALVTITATDPSVDLLAMAESDPPEPWSPGPDQTVLSGTHEGFDWNLIVRLNAVYGFHVCLVLVPDGVHGCSLGAVTAPGPFMPDGSNPRFVEPDSGAIGFFVGGRAPQCATQVKIPTNGGTQFTSVDTVDAPDGHPYFAIWIPVDGFYDGPWIPVVDESDESSPSRQPLEAIDGAGATVGTNDGSGWASDEC